MQMYDERTRGMKSILQYMEEITNYADKTK